MSLSSELSWQPSRSQSLEFAGRSKSWVDAQFACPPRGQSSGELSVIPSLSSSESQASPWPSPSVFPWPGFTTLGQLSLTSGMPSASLSVFFDGSMAQTKTSQPPVLVTVVLSLVMVAGLGPAKEPITVAISVELTARSHPTSRLVLPVTSSQAQPPEPLSPPTRTSASKLGCQLLLVPVTDFVPPLKVPSTKKDEKIISPREVISMPERLSPELEPPVAAH